MKHTFAVRVYYQHTDAGGVVYHGTYLDFMEAGRTEMLRSLGFDVAALAQAGLVFVVHSLNIKYRKPGHLGDDLQVRTCCSSVAGARLVLDQDILRGDQLIAEAQVTLVCVSSTGFRPTPMPDAMKVALAAQSRELNPPAAL
jgi:acyl-CoA thioester hydrolase